MYLVKYEPTKSFIPCKTISWSMGDYYACSISVEDEFYYLTKEIMARRKDIFPVDVNKVATDAFDSVKIRRESPHEGIGREMRSLNDVCVEEWFYSDGGLFTDFMHIEDGYFSQFVFDNDILSKPGITLYNDPVIPSGRITIDFIDRPEPVSEPRVFTPNKQHESILAYIHYNGPATTFEIAEKLGYPISSVAGRVSELSRAGELRCVSIDYSTGNKRNVWGNRNHKSWV